MECKSKEVIFTHGTIFYMTQNKVEKWSDQTLHAMCIIDKKGKSISISDGQVAFQIPFKPIMKTFEELAQNKNDIGE